MITNYKPYFEDEKTYTCEWCEEEFYAEDLYITPSGMVLCSHCVDAIRSRGERVSIEPYRPEDEE